MKRTNKMNKLQKINQMAAGILLVVLLLAAVECVSAQQPDRGFQAANTYAASGLDAVNLSNGNVIINLPVASLPAGRGTSPGHTVTLQYNSKLWDSQQTSHDNGNPDEYGNDNFQTTALIAGDTGGWHLNSQYLVRVTDRLNLETPNVCWLGDPVEHIAFRWKVEMTMPDGSIKQFFPDTAHTYMVGMGDDGYANIDPNGMVYTATQGTHPATGNCMVTDSYYQSTTGGMNYITMDGSRIRLYMPYATSAPILAGMRNWKLYFPDGTMVENAPPSTPTVAQRITDRNGNYIEVIENKIIDQLGRYIEFTSDPQTGEWIVRTKGVGGENVDTRIKWTTRWVNRAYTLSRDPRAPYPFYTAGQLFYGLGVVEKITFPSQLGDQKMLFEYYGDATQPSSNDFTEGWGEIKEITLPTGAKSQYQYSEDDDIASAILDRYATRKDLKYHEKYDGSTSAEKTDSWLYNVSKWANGVTNPSGASSSEVLLYNMSSSLWNNGLAYRSNQPDGSVVERLWSYNLPYGIPETQPTVPGRFSGIGSGNSYVKAEFTTLADLTGTISSGSPTAIKEYKYDKNGNVLEIKEYDWVTYSSVPRSGSGFFAQVTGLPSSGLTLKRKTINTFYNQAADADSTTANVNSYNDPSSPKLKNVIKSTEVQDGSSVVKARTEFYYDDASNTGNLTETRMWDSTKGAVSNPLTTGTNGNSVSTSTTYNSYGAPTLVTDANGNQTNITYGNISGPNGNVTGLYPTMTETAYGTAVERTSTAVYDFYTGVVTTATDADNSVSTVTEYDDLGRPTKVKTGAGTALESWVRTEYDNVERRVIVRADLETIGDGKKVSIQHYDELGRVRLTRSLEDAATEDPEDEQDGIKVQTRYKYHEGTDPNSPADNQGTYLLTSNPYRATTSSGASNEPTMGWTLSYSTSSGRNTTATSCSGSSLPAPWGNNSTSTGTVLTDLDANRSLVTDQAGKQKISKSNVLGQLTDVWEVTSSDGSTVSVTFPGSNGTGISAGYRTVYAYDLLGNLSTVTQGGQTRTFSYSSLSRLSSAVNPESGTVSYAYDKSGNLTQKTDARSIQTGYTYDALNRVTFLNYSDSTPDVTYTYDNKTYSKGKLTKVSTSVSSTEFLTFDLLGRVTRSQQVTDGVVYGTTNDDAPMTYKYNLSGAMIEQKYPSGRIVKTVLDNEGDLSAVQSKKNASSGPMWNYARNFTYNAAGAVTSMQIGNGHWESTAFNSRLQPTQIALGKTAGTTNLLKLDYAYGVWNGSTVDTTKNNGNIATQDIAVPNAGGATGFYTLQLYTYDSLNRLGQATELVTDGVAPSTVSWQQTFSYDRYGNRNFHEPGTTTLPKNCSGAVCAADRKVLNPSISAANNRIVLDQDSDSVDDYTFDSSGNTIKTADGNTFVYDAENKQIEAKNSSSVTIGQYWYDGDGRRVKKYVPATGEVTIFVYDGSGKMVAEYSTVLNPTPQISYLTNDHLGSPRINTDIHGAVISRNDYHPFGEEIVSSHRTAAIGYASDAIRKQFAGYERDGETDLDFAQARYFDSGFGRFSSPDDFLNDTSTSNPQSWNLYVYAGNNPLRYIDPSGEIKKNADGSLQTDARNGEDQDDLIIGDKTYQFYGKEFEKDGKKYRIVGEVKKVWLTADDDKTKIKATIGVGDLKVIETSTIKEKTIEGMNGQEIKTGVFTASGKDLGGNVADVVPSMAGVSHSCDCHGSSFADGKAWINNDQVGKILSGDGYTQTSTPQSGDVGVYGEYKEKTKDGKTTLELKRAEHSVTVAEVSGGNVTNVISKGGITPAVRTSPSNAWKEGVKVVYWTKKNK